MVFEHLKSGVEIDDTAFDVIYTKKMRALSKIHFTPIEVAKTAAQFLVDKRGIKILDIGSGAGKFCIVGSACTNGHFTGVEQRKNLYRYSQKLLTYYQLQNLTFIHSNITDIEFAPFEAFYIFNPFYENIVQSGSVDDTVKLDKFLYPLYSFYVKRQLDAMPAGTRLATYFSYLDEVPGSYEIVRTDFDKKLKMWVKKF